jgi:hypothetical protein
VNAVPTIKTRASWERETALARRLSGGPEDGGRTTDHTDEIAALRVMADVRQEHYDRLVLLTAAELLALHDDGTIVLDHWHEPRALVELLIKAPILECGLE